MRMVLYFCTVLSEPHDPSHTVTVRRARMARFYEVLVNNTGLAVAFGAVRIRE